MMNKSNDKSIMVIKEDNIFNKIIRFIKRIFNKNNTENINVIKEEKKTTNIIKNNVARLDENEIIFQNFRKGLVKEYELSDEEKEKISLKYDERIQKEQEEIEYYRQKILGIRKKLANI